MSYPPFVTSSGVDRFLACTGSAHLTKVAEDASKAAMQGVDDHAVKLQPGQLPQKVLDWFGGRDPLYEVAMAADCESDAAVFVGQYVERAYPSFPTARWLAGSGDMIQIEGDVLSVGDLKTGRGQSRGALSPPSEAGQLLSLAWMATRLRQAKVPTWRPRRVRLMWWLTAERPDDVDDAEITYEQLMNWAARFCDEVKRSSKDRLHRGPQCANCPAFDACPAQGGAIRRMLAVSEKLARHSVNDVSNWTDEEISTAYQILEEAERACETTRAALKRRVEDRGDVLVGDKHRLKLIRGSTTQISSAVAADVLGEDLFAQCATITVSQASLMRGLDNMAEVADVMARIKERGGLVTASKSPYLKVVKR